MHFVCRRAIAATFIDVFDTEATAVEAIDFIKALGVPSVQAT
ncbi:hypothetical protein [Marinomonas spartinae]|nr:hypothetical protein [Marinomonas spartinae]